MTENVFRKIDETEARRLLSADEAARLDENRRYAAHRWPGEYNLRLLAEAVDKRRHYVDFDNGTQRFSIRYESRYEAVFIKPANGGFVPCGYIPYQRLKEALASEQPNA